jgi:hypothetical protein
LTTNLVPFGVTGHSATIPLTEFHVGTPCTPDAASDSRSLHRMAER